MKRPALIALVVIVLILNAVAIYFSFSKFLGDAEEDLVASYNFNDGNPTDSSWYRNHGKVYGARFNPHGGPAGDGAFEFDGVDDSIVLPNRHYLSPADTKEFTISFWVQFNDLEFSAEDGKAYAQFLGKSQPDNHEFAFRIYNSSNAEDKAYRLSFYLFNREGGLGSGSYIQEPIGKGEWMFIVGVFNGTHIMLWKNGVLRDTVPASQYNVTVTRGDAPVTLGTTQFSTYFKGSIDDLAIYRRVLDDREIAQLHLKRENG